MITVCRAKERRLVQRGKQETWISVFPLERSGPIAVDCGVQAIVNEISLPPAGGSVPCLCDEAEIITYVHKGALTQEDSAGYSGSIHAGEFQRLSTRCAVKQKEINGSRTDWAHLFKIVLQSSKVGFDFPHEQAHFTTAQRHNVLCVVASHDGQKGSLRIGQNALIGSSILDPGNHLVHELRPGQRAWLHVVFGEVMLEDLVLNQGDGVGITGEPSASLTAQENTEILLIELGPAMMVEEIPP